MSQSINRKAQTKIVWDKTNIGENYPGITTPLTYSFIKEAYASVYHNFMRLLGVNEEVLEENSAIFGNMIGYVYGQVFYNISNWYELLKLLPGYTYNKQFFENMLNPARRFPQAQEKRKLELKTVWRNRFVLLRLVKYIILTGPLYTKFEKGFEQLTRKYQNAKASDINNIQLVAEFKRLEKKFFSIWSYTIVNDFKVMIFYGLLKKFSTHYLNDSGFVIDQVYSTTQYPRSIKPMQELLDLARVIHSNQEYQDLFKLDATQVVRALQQEKNRSLSRQLEKYIQDYGERSRNELKLEDVNFKDNPEELILLLKYYLEFTEGGYVQKDISSEHKQRVKENSVIKKLPFLPRLVYYFLQRHTIQSIYKREDYRMKRGKAFNMAREIFFEIGRRMCKSSLLDDPSDVLFLYKEEIFDHLRFHRIMSNFKNTVHYRKELLKQYKKQILPRRVITYGMPEDSDPVVDMDIPESSTRVLCGQVTARGTVNGAEVVVMPTLDLTVNLEDKILVTYATDPGWTMVFPLLRGVITEEGGILSHASIVARELGIICIVKVPNVTQILQTGDVVQMDDTTGEIRIVEHTKTV